MLDKSRERLHIAVDKLPASHLADVLQFVELLLDSEPDANLELEEAWMLASGAFRVIVPDNGELPRVFKA